MVELSEFLLARYAEDQRRAPESHRIECRSLDALLDGFGRAEPCNCDLPASLLAEVEAKRRIVELYVDMEVLPDDERNEQRVTLRWVLEVLALPFVDHPDYRQEWKP